MILFTQLPVDKFENITNNIFMASLNMNNSAQSYSQLYQRLGAHVQSVIEQVSLRLKNFLDSINIVYESNGINFPVKHNFTNLMRILAPFQLLSRFQVIQNNQILSQQLLTKMAQTQQNQAILNNSNAQLPKLYPHSQRQTIQNSQFPQSKALELAKKMKQINQNYKQRQIFDKNYKQKKNKEKQEKIQNPNYGQDNYLAERLKRDSTRDYRKKGIVGKKKQDLSGIQQKKNYYMRNSIYLVEGPKNQLSEDLEMQLCAWAINRLESGKALLAREIASHAKYLGRNIPNLRANESWVQKFFMKYPQVHNKYRKAKHEVRNKQYKFTYNAQPIRQSSQKDINIDQYNIQPANLNMSIFQNDSEDNNQKESRNENEQFSIFQEYEQDQYDHKQNSQGMESQQNNDRNYS